MDAFLYQLLESWLKEPGRKWSCGKITLISDSLCGLVKDLFQSKFQKQALRVHSASELVSHNLIFCDNNFILTHQWSLTAPRCKYNLICLKSYFHIMTQRDFKVFRQSQNAIHLSAPFYQGHYLQKEWALWNLLRCGIQLQAIKIMWFVILIMITSYMYIFVTLFSN